jgi:hypothetical protein
MIFYLLLSAAFAIAAVGATAFLRVGSEKDREGLTDAERYRAILRLFLLGIFAPWPICYILYTLVFAGKSFFTSMTDGARTGVLLLLGTACTAAGLPFVMKMIRLFRRDSSAHAVSLSLSAYGSILWFGFNLLLLALFMGRCC